MCSYIQCEGGAQIGKSWHETPYITCDFCKTEDLDCFIDGRVEGSTKWGIMCLDCFKVHGLGLGLGLGQKYCKKQ